MDSNDADASRRDRYHHGDLRSALIEATLKLVEEDGLDGVSVRKAADRAGVSPGAPFRHFSSRVALLTAVAEEAMDRLVAAIDRALAEACTENPLRQFHAVGAGFLRWALANPSHFQIISTRQVIDFEGSMIAAQNAAVQARMRDMLARADDQGLIDVADLNVQMIAGRALVYGLARMYIDGQFKSWNLPADDALAACMTVLDAHIASIAVR